MIELYYYTYTYTYTEKNFPSSKGSQTFTITSLLCLTLSKRFCPVDIALSQTQERRPSTITSLTLSV